MAEHRAEVAVIGGGIVGLAAAMELLRRRPGLRLVLLEKEPEIARHQTGNNSGVIHAGIYYVPGSLKAKTCVTGKEQLLRFCDEHGVPYDMCGKVIVATTDAERPRLRGLLARGKENGVPGLELVGPERLRELEPCCVGVEALHSPQTGIVDYGAVSRAMAREIERLGGVILTGHEVTGIAELGGKYELETPHGAVEAANVISCAGLQSDRVARMTGAASDPKIVPFRGDYYVMRRDRTHMIRSMIYPVPDPRFPFLGVHFTRRMDGGVWLGPNAVLAFAREGYGKLQVDPRDVLETLTYSGFGKLAMKFWRTGMDELYRDFSKAAFLAALRVFVPQLTMEDMEPGPAGVRAQALNYRGELVDDFIVNHQGRALHVRNAPSPAATSCLAIGDLIADRAEAAFALA